MTEADPISDILNNGKTVAVVGLSNSRERAAYGVAAYLQQQGYRVIPVHPEADEVLGEKVYRSVSEIPDQVDIVDIFRRADAVVPIVEDAIKKGGVKAIWMQEMVRNEEAATKARDAGMAVVMDRCILKEHRARHR